MVLSKRYPPFTGNGHEISLFVIIWDKITAWRVHVSQIQIAITGLLNTSGEPDRKLCLDRFLRGFTLNFSGREKHKIKTGVNILRFTVSVSSNVYNRQDHD